MPAITGLRAPDLGRTARPTARLAAVTALASPPSSGRVRVSNFCVLYSLSLHAQPVPVSLRAAIAHREPVRDHAHPPEWGQRETA